MGVVLPCLYIAHFAKKGWVPISLLYCSFYRTAEPYPSVIPANAGIYLRYTHRLFSGRLACGERPVASEVELSRTERRPSKKIWPPNLFGGLLVRRSLPAVFVADLLAVGEAWFIRQLYRIFGKPNSSKTWCVEFSDTLWSPHFSINALYNSSLICRFPTNTSILTNHSHYTRRLFCRCIANCHLYELQSRPTNFCPWRFRLLCTLLIPLLVFLLLLP